MSRTSAPPAPHSTIAQALAQDRLGIPSVVYFVLSGVAPLTVAAGVVTTAYAVTGLHTIPAAFLAVAAILGIFSVGYVAMAKHIPNAGAFYAFISQGLGKPVGVGAALVAVAAYNMLQIGAYGMFGAMAADLAAAELGVDAPWWAWAVGAWVVVTTLGLRRVELSGKVLAVLGTAEVVAVVALTGWGLSRPAGGHVSFASLDPAGLASAGLGAALVIAVLGYVGFESAAVFAEESKDPRRTVRIATYLSLSVIAVVYAAASWALAVAYGDDKVAATAQKQGPEMLFGLGPELLGQAGRLLFLTSLFAAMLAFHNAVGRYMFALGREHVLPPALGRTSLGGAPKIASITQSTLGLMVIVLYAVAGWDPMVQLFFWGGTTGGFGVLLLLAVTSVAVIRYFRQHPHIETPWRRVIAPGISAVTLTVMVVLVARNFSTLLGVPPGSTVAWALPAVFGGLAVVGITWALVLRSTQPVVYAAIGFGPQAATVSANAATSRRPVPDFAERVRP